MHEEWCRDGAMAKGGFARRVCCFADCGTCNQPRCYRQSRSRPRDRCCLFPDQVHPRARICANSSDVSCILPLIPGFTTDIPRDYDLAAINESARAWPQMRRDGRVAAALRARHERARAQCGSDGPWRQQGLLHTSQLASHLRATGGFCLLPEHMVTVHTEYVGPGDGGTRVSLPRNNQSYYLPPPYAPADARVLSMLLRILLPQEANAAGALHLSLFESPRPMPVASRDALDGQARRRTRRHRGPHIRPSVLDLGAGVGTYGRALRSFAPPMPPPSSPRLNAPQRDEAEAWWQEQVRWIGYDGAGNVEEVSGGLVRFADLTMPLALPRAEWVMALEVAEHVPHEYEATVLQNLHAHNCRGIIISWAILGQPGQGHVNNHGNDYVIKTFEALGYKHHSFASHRLRDNHPGTENLKGLPSHLSINQGWLKRSALVFERWTPLTADGCADGHNTSVYQSV